MNQNWDSINAEAEASAREAMREQILHEEIDRYKQDLRKGYQEELRQLADESRAEILSL